MDSKLEPRGRVHYLSLGHIFHAISYDETEQNITVKRYHLKQKLNQSQFFIPYRYCLLPGNSQSFISSSINIQHTGDLHVNWNSVDQLICGESDALDYNLPLWRIHFVIIPPFASESNTEQTIDFVQVKQAEQKQITAFLNFKRNLFRNNRIFKQELNPDIEIVISNDFA